MYFKHHPLTIALLSTITATLPISSAFAKTENNEVPDTLVVSAQALKVNTSLQETPKSVSIISQQELETRAPQKLDEALRYTSGVVAQPFGADNDTDWFKIRGFDAATYLDNSRLFRDGYYTWLLEPYGFERIEVVKGASAVLFGESTPGGAVNVVTKKPLFTPKGEVFLEAGNNDQRGFGFDVTGNANDEGNVRYRLVGTMKKGDGELKHTDNERIYLAPSLAIDLSDDTMLTLMGTYLHDDGTPTNPFFPAAGTSIKSPFGKIKPSTNLGEPDYDKYKRNQLSAGYLLEHSFNDTWRFSQRLNYGYNKLTLRSVYAFPNADTSATELSRGVVFRDGKNQSITFDNNVVGEWDSERFEHTLLAGVELQYHQTKGAEQDYLPSKKHEFGKINPWNPIYGKYNPIDPANNINRTIDKTQSSLYSQYQVKFDSQWIGVAGLRYDWVKTENKNKTNHINKSRNDGEFSLNTGVMYLADNGLSPYASYSQSFEVMSTLDSATGELYDPLKGEQFELGVKYTPDYFDGYINVAWFDIEQKNALVTNPKTSVATQTGKVTSTGIEIEAVAQLTDNVNIQSAYTYTKAKTDNTGGQGKKQAGLIPMHMASAWANYTIPLTNTQEITLGSGVRYLGQSKDNPASSNRSVASATLWDAAATYKLNKQWQLQLNVNNLLNKEYISACDYYCYYGQSRSVVIQTKYNW
ncbi:TonB-dependent siderophore receptor [Providencia heimbachae]|uniref:TonB-dependent siderophore receptor n=1 Tax=Providencia heimbachae TaxID=333962 RepID=UPI0010BF50A8|nr:TonB-dependent siderophore receptor [Providencia heimbachae]QCJ70561.1 TonB-dependent siderophore receptor [Providencia heimbachae]